MGSGGAWRGEEPAEGGEPARRTTSGLDRGTGKMVAKERLRSHRWALAVRCAPANARTASSDAGSWTLRSPPAVGAGPGAPNDLLARGHTARKPVQGGKPPSQGPPAVRPLLARGLLPRAFSTLKVRCGQVGGFGLWAPSWLHEQ